MLSNRVKVNGTIDVWVRFRASVKLSRREHNRSPGPYVSSMDVL